MSRDARGDGAPRLARQWKDGRRDGPHPGLHALSCPAGIRRSARRRYDDDTQLGFCQSRAAFIPAAIAMGLSPSDVGAHIAIAAAALLICVGLFSLNVIGGGDAKVIGATVLWVGASGLEDFLLVTSLAGGTLALVLVLLRRSGLRSSRRWAHRLLSPSEGAPYAVAIAIGALFAVPASPLLAEGLTRF